MYNTFNDAFTALQRHNRHPHPELASLVISLDTLYALSRQHLHDKSLGREPLPQDSSDFDTALRDFVKAADNYREEVTQ